MQTDTSHIGPELDHVLTEVKFFYVWTGHRYFVIEVDVGFVVVDSLLPLEVLVGWVGPGGKAGHPQSVHENHTKLVQHRLDPANPLEAYLLGCLATDLNRSISLSKCIRSVLLLHCLEEGDRLLEGSAATDERASSLDLAWISVKLCQYVWIGCTYS